ncbi:hypothetical protein ARSEF4850_008499 [Beauveria asiatica]
MKAFTSVGLFSLIYSIAAYPLQSVSSPNCQPGHLVCQGEGNFGICNFGSKAIFMDVSEGTKCVCSGSDCTIVALGAGDFKPPQNTSVPAPSAPQATPSTSRAAPSTSSQAAPTATLPVPETSSAASSQPSASASNTISSTDTCAVPDFIASTHSLKQVIAACSPDTSRQPSVASHAYFSPCLTAALRQLSRATSFSVEQLCNEINTASQANVNSSLRFSSPAFEPQFFTMTPGQGKNIQLAPLPESSSDAVIPETTRPRDAPLSPTTGPKLTFDEARIPGMFFGPPTVLLIFMPTSLWASVQDDKIWYYLGSIASRNLVSLYDKMVATSDTSTEMIEASTAITTALESTSTSEQTRTTSDGQTSPTARLYQSLAAGGLGTKPRAHGAESVEMQEAAEQLKALSHVCHRSSDVAASTADARAG